MLPLDFVAERLAGERVDGQRHGDVGQFRGQCAVVLRGVEAQGLDVPQQRDPLVDPPLRCADVGEERHEGIGENVPAASSTLTFGASASTCQEGRRDRFHDVVEAFLELSLLVQEDHLVGRESLQPLLGEAALDEAPTGGA